MEPNRKSNYSYIERVNDHRSCYRIKTNDGLKLELDKSEIGRFIPQKGMSVQIRLFNGTVLQEVFLNGICVVRRSPQKLLDILAGLSAELRKAQDECEKFSALENSRWLSEFAAGFSASSSASETDNAKRFYGRNNGKTDCRLSDCCFFVGSDRCVHRLCRT